MKASTNNKHDMKNNGMGKLKENEQTVLKG